MANTFKNAKLALTTTLTDVYTCPAATTVVVTLAQVGNIHATDSVEVDFVWTDASAADAATYVVKSLIVPVKSSIGLLTGKLVLEAGDKLRAKASAATAAELSISVLELT